MTRNFIVTSEAAMSGGRPGLPGFLHNVKTSSVRFLKASQ